MVNGFLFLFLLSLQFKREHIGKETKQNKSELYLLCKSFEKYAYMNIILALISIFHYSQNDIIIKIIIKHGFASCFFVGIIVVV